MFWFCIPIGLKSPGLCTPNDTKNASASTLPDGVSMAVMRSEVDSIFVAMVFIRNAAPFSWQSLASSWVNSLESPLSSVGQYKPPAI